MRIYYEMTNGGAQAQPSRRGWTSVPVGVSYFPAELYRLPKLYACLLLDSQAIELTLHRLDGRTRSAISCSSLSMTLGAISQRSRFRRSLRETFARCMGRVALRTASFRVRVDMMLKISDCRFCLACIFASGFRDRGWPWWDVLSRPQKICKDDPSVPQPESI